MQLQQRLIGLESLHVYSHFLQKKFADPWSRTVLLELSVIKNQFHFIYLFFISLFIYLFIFGCVGSSLWYAGFSLRWLLLLWSMGSRRVGSVAVARGLQSTGSVVVAHRLSWSVACGILPDQGWNPCPLHQQVDS